MTIRIGANPIGWSNDDMRELGGATPLETCLAEAAEIGFEGMELGHKFPRQAAALRQALAPFGLACVSGWYSMALLRRDVEAELAAARAHIDLLRAMECDVMIVAETSNAIHGDVAMPLSRRPVLRPEEWERWGQALTRFGDALLEAGLRLVYHHHMGTIVQSGADIDRLMAVTGPSVHLLLDTGHATWGGADPAELARRHRARIAHVHTKDVRPAVMARSAREDWSFLRSVVAGVYTVPGDGTIDFPAVFAELAGYGGWVIVEAEQDPAKADPKTYAALGYRNLRRWLEEAGLRP